MKKFLLILSIISFNYLQSQDGWINQRKPINVALNACCFPVDTGTFNGYNYWIVGDSGYILKSNAYQNAWSRLESCTTENLNGVYFFHNGTGFCVGDNGTLIKTETFGNQWEYISLDLNTGLKDILFITDSSAFIAGDSGLLLKSTDKGMTWANLELNTSHSLNKIRKLNDSLIWIVGDHGTVFRTNDGGNNWININTGIQNNLNDFFIPDSECVVIVGDDGLVIKSEDGGVNWINLGFPGSSKLNGVTGGGNCNTFYVCGNEGTIYYWSIYDTTWHACQEETGGLDFHSIIFQPDDYYSLFLADSGSYIIASGFGGYSFLNKAEENLFFRDIEFVDPLNGYVAGNVATLLHTTDGGENWHSLHLGDFPGNESGLDAVDVEFTDPMHGFVLLHRYLYHEHSIILSTHDGGLTWTNCYYSNIESLNCMYFLDSLHGWVGGRNGFIMKTNNGGQTWMVVQGHNYNLNATVKIHFNNLLDGYFIRDYGDFYVTHDGGITCELTMSFGDADDFSVVRDSLIWVVRNGVYHSTNGGYLWNYQPIPNNGHYPNAVCFIDELEGWLAGSDRALWYTNDGGENWHLESAENNGDNFMYMTFTDAKNGYVIGGYDNFIMHGPGLYTGNQDDFQLREKCISFFPNPARSFLNIKIRINDIDQDLSLPLTISVFNMTGQKVMGLENITPSETITIDISALTPGIYFMLLYSGAKADSYKKFIVIR